MFDYKEFVKTYEVKPAPTQYSAHFYAPDDTGDWCIMWSGLITRDGVIELMNQHDEGNISLTDIQVEKGQS